MAIKKKFSLYLRLIAKPCLARNLVLVNNNDGTATIDNKIYESIAKIEILLNSVKRKDLSKKGKKY